MLCITSGEPNFLTIQRYCPWDIRNWEEMKQFPELVLALALRASARG